ncbi:MAG TPA: flagellar hook-associated protein FlgK, partial [Firmicutes bacterium]|nr:flagellar hook-associated protein FlgK [Bacillota bacterium]
MSTGTFGSFEIGRRALHAQQKGAKVAGQNIANANTEGYSRQVLRLEALVPPAVPGVVTPPGYGVAVSRIDRVTSRFYTHQLMQGLTAEHYWGRLGETLGGIETMFLEPGETGINAQLGEFFDAWQELSVNPESFAARVSLREQAQALIGTVRDVYTRLDGLKYDLQKETEAVLPEVNTIAAEVAALNQKIVQLHALGKRSNEILDQRDLQLQELSKRLNIRVIERGNGSLEVQAGGRILLHDDHHYPLELLTEADRISIVNNIGAVLDVSGGTLEGLLESYNRVIPHYQEALDRLVYQLVGAVNGQHRAGLGLDGSLGNDFFRALPEQNRAAASFSLDTNILADLNRIAAANATTGPGNGINALNIAGLRVQSLMGGGTATFHDYYRSMIANLGVEGREAARMHHAMQAATDSFRARQDAVAGVSLDDEMLSLIQFQHA